MEHRRPRRPTNILVRFITAPTTIGTGRVINMSSTGAFMETQVPLRLLSLVYLQPIEQPADNPHGRLAATVVRRDVSGFGLAWCEFAADTTAGYAGLIMESYDLADVHQLPLPAIPDALPVPHLASCPVELRGLCRLEFLG
jgi:hypothetical protein